MKDQFQFVLERGYPFQEYLMQVQEYDLFNEEKQIGKLPVLK